ncbi:MAG: hypothetical protein KDI16_12945 [Halioglobus sp.]|nr:hypothetical protein [Halioglobus sp.]
MNTTGWRAALLAAALLTCPVLSAQPPAGAAEPRGEPQDDTANQGVASSAAPATAPDGDSARPSPRREDSPFDYRASEQISEDLSVSFPVDI